MAAATTPPRDGLGYTGRRCVVAGAATTLGSAVTRLLVAVGAEVHVIDAPGAEPDVTGLASRTPVEFADDVQVRAAAARIGAVVEAAFDCTITAPHTSQGPAALSPVLRAVLPFMVADAAAVAVVMTASDGFVPDGADDDVRMLIDTGSTRSPAPGARAGVRVHTVHCEGFDLAARDDEDDDRGGALDALDALAWLVVMVASPRAGALASATIRARA